MQKVPYLDQGSKGPAATVVESLARVLFRWRSN